MEMTGLPKRIVDAIESEPQIVEQISEFHWMSGCSTDVAPITLWRDCVEVQMKPRSRMKMRMLKRAIDKILKAYKDLFRAGCYWKSDGSCPDTITFWYTEDTAKELVG